MNSWVAIIIGTDGKKSRVIVAGETRDQALATAQQYTGCHVEKLWPATGKYESLHLGRISSGMRCIGA